MKFAYADDLAADKDEEPHYAALDETVKPWSWDQPVVSADDWCGEWRARAGS